MKKKVTSTDIAHAAGVSQSTVSMILNKKYDVSFAKDTVERVENAAKELGYVPPKRKTRKGTKREKLLVVFCPNLTNPYYVMLLQGIEAHAKEKGFGLFVCNTQRDLRMEERYLKMMWQLDRLELSIPVIRAIALWNLWEKLQNRYRLRSSITRMKR